MKFLCNEYTTSSVAGIQVDKIQAGDGVNSVQAEYYLGSSVSSGNVFSSNNKDFVNNVMVINYYHNGGNTFPTIGGTEYTYRGHAVLANQCPTSFTNGGAVVLPTPFGFVMDSLEIKLEEYELEYNDLQYIYQSLIDGGHTEEVLQKITTEWSADIWLLRNELILKSLFLSTAVLLEVAKEGKLPNGMLLEVLIANPEATCSERFIDALEEATNYSLPAYMIGLVKESWKDKTVRTELELYLSDVSSKLSEVRESIKYLFKAEDEKELEKLQEVLSQGDELFNKVGLIDFYISQKDFNKADSVLTALENDKHYSDDLGLIASLGEYLSFRSSLGNRTLAQLDESEISYLQTIAENKDRAAGYAQNILCFFYDICYDKELTPAHQAKSANAPINTSDKALNEVLYNATLYPNPANSHTSIKWEIYEELQNAKYTLIDLNGSVLLQGELSTNKGEKVLDTRKIGQGTYLLPFTTTIP